MEGSLFYSTMDPRVPTVMDERIYKEWMDHRLQNNKLTDVSRDGLLYLYFRLKSPASSMYLGVVPAAEERKQLDAMLVGEPVLVMLTLYDDLIRVLFNV